MSASELLMNIIETFDVYYAKTGDFTLGPKRTISTKTPRADITISLLNAEIYIESIGNQTSTTTTDHAKRLLIELKLCAESGRLLSHIWR